MALAMSAFTFGIALAQSDDVYFVPSKADKAKSKTETVEASTYTPLPYNSNESDGVSEHDNWADGRGNGHWDVDQYNRRNEDGNYSSDNDTLADDAYSDGYGDNSCTSLIVRFHSPRVGVYVSSPYYWSLYDPWFDPWFYDSWYSFGWPATYYGWGWRPWRWGYYGWYDPWYPGWGWGPSWGWYPHYHGPSYAWNAQRGPHGGFVAYGNGRASRPGFSNSVRPSGTRYANYRPSRNFGNGLTNRPSRSAYRDSYRPSRNFGNSSSVPSRNYNNRPSYTPSRSFGNSGARPTFSSPSRSFGGGSGGGRSFGGRR